LKGTELATADDQQDEHEQAQLVEPALLGVHDAELDGWPQAADRGAATGPTPYSVNS